MIKRIGNWADAHAIQIMDFFRHAFELIGVFCLIMWTVHEAFYVSDLTSLVAAIACGVAALVVGMEAKEL